MHVCSQFRIIWHQVQVVHLDATKRKNPRKSLELKQINLTDQLWVAPLISLYHCCDLMYRRDFVWRTTRMRLLKSMALGGRGTTDLCSTMTGLWREEAGQEFVVSSLTIIKQQLGGSDNSLCKISWKNFWHKTLTARSLEGFRKIALD